MSTRTDEQARAYTEQMGETAAQRQKRAAAKKCKSCHAPIIWAKSDGKWMPLNYDPDEGGNVFLFLDGKCKVGRQDDATPQFATRHFSHFATCPNADEHRR